MSISCETILKIETIWKSALLATFALYNKIYYWARTSGVSMQNGAHGKV